MRGEVRSVIASGTSIRSGSRGSLMTHTPTRRAFVAGFGAAIGASTAGIAGDGPAVEPAHRPSGPWLKRPDDASGLYDVAWAAGEGFPVPLNGVDDDGVGLQRVIDKYGCRLFNSGRFINLKSRGLVYEGQGAVIMGGSPEASIVCRHPSLQTVESVAVPYPKSGTDESAWGLAAIRLGSRTDGRKGAGRALVSGLRWVHPGRGPVGPLAGTEGLAGKLAHGEAMLEVWGAAGVTIERCQDGGAVYTYAIYGGDNVHLVRCRGLSQIWDRRNPNAQEGRATVLLAHGGVHGAGTSFWARDCEFYGGASTDRQTWTVQDGNAAPGQAGAASRSAANVAYSSTRRAGPLAIFDIQSREDWYILDCFSAGADRTNIRVAAVRPEDVLLNGQIRGGDHDESNNTNLYVTRAEPNLAQLVRLRVASVNFNGQGIGTRAIIIDGDRGIASVAMLEIENIVTTAHAGCPIKLSGVDGGHLRASLISGYNLAGNDIAPPARGSLADVSGLHIAGQTRNFRVDDVTFVGPVNGTTGANNAQVGYLDETRGRGNTYSGLKAINLGKAGGRAIWSGARFVEDLAP